MDKFDLKRITLSRSNYHIFLASDLAITSINEKALEKDYFNHGLYNIKDGMKLFFVYFYSYKDKGDTSEFKKNVKIFNIECIIVESANSLRI